MLLSPHFTIEELTRTRTGLDNDPPLGLAADMILLAEDLLEPIRELLGVPLIVHSGYRSPDVNRAVGGARNSAHLEGRACDFHPGQDMPLRMAFERVRRSQLPYDKLLLERAGSSMWIHVQHARRGGEPRREAYTAEVGPEGTVYTRVQDDAHSQEEA